MVKIASQTATFRLTPQNARYIPTLNSTERPISGVLWNSVRWRHVMSSQGPTKIRGLGGPTKIWGQPSPDAVGRGNQTGSERLDQARHLMGTESSPWNLVVY